MQINPLNSYKILSFGKEKDENQPVADAMRAIFRNNDIPKSRQRILWELSEVPDFYEASKDASERELIELANYMAGRKTNILQMALDGDVRLFKKNKKDEVVARNLLSLKEFILRNQHLPEGQRMSLADFLKSHFVSQIEQDAVELKLDTKNYPKTMRYIKDDSEKDNIRYARINDGAATMKSIVGIMSGGVALDDDDVAIVFEEDIKERKGHNRGGFVYPMIDPAIIEDEYAVAYPELYRVLEESRDVPSKIKKNIAELRKIPYFKNLTKNTHPINLLGFSKINLIFDNMLTKMLKQEVTLDVRNPNNGEYVKTPVIDMGKLLYKINRGIIKEKQVDEIIQKNTLAFELCGLYTAKKDDVNGKITAIELERFGNNLGFVIKTDSGEKYPDCISPEGKEAVQKILDELDKFPFKKAVLNLESKK